jgi:hypothetical protein
MHHPASAQAGGVWCVFLTCEDDDVAGIPFSDVNLRTHNVHQPPWTQFSSLSEVSTLSMEFTFLERAAGARSSTYSYGMLHILLCQRLSLVVNVNVSVKIRKQYGP